MLESVMHALGWLFITIYFAFVMVMPTPRLRG